MFTLIWIIFVIFILILVAISEYEIAKQDEEWMKEEEKEMEKEVKPYCEDDYQALDEVDTVDLLEMKEGALNDLNENERTIHRINQILASRAIYATQLELF